MTTLHLLGCTIGVVSSGVDIFDLRSFSSTQVLHWLPLCSPFDRRSSGTNGKVGHLVLAFLKNFLDLLYAFDMLLVISFVLFWMQ